MILPTGAWYCTFFNVGTADNESGNTDLYSQAVISLDFKIGAGNNGAVALRMQGAEGCTIEDVRIDMTEGGHTGIWGIPGSGGATHGVTIIGGVIGIDTRTRTLGGGGSQPSPLVTGSTFINQSERAVEATARGSLVMVGCHFERTMPGPFFRLQRHWVGQPFDASFQVIDSTIVYQSYAASNTVLDMTGAVGRSFYFDNVYVYNGRRIFQANIPSNSNGWTHFERAALHVRPQARGWGQPEEPVYIDGIRYGDVFVQSTDGVEPPADLQTRHQFPVHFPTWETPGIVNVRDLGAVGDGVTDDWEVLQNAINDHEIVFLPAGMYAVSRTLELRPDSKIIGSHPTFTGITAITTLANRFNGVQEGEPDAPIIRSADVAGAETWLALFQIRRVFPIAQHNPTPPANFALEWRSGGNSLLRQLKVESRTSNNVRPDFIASIFYGINIIENRIDPNHPQRSFGEGQYAWPNKYPNVLITGNGGGRWFTFWVHGRQAMRQETPFLLVQDTREPLHIYHLHLQQQDSRNHAEFRNAHNVSIYNTKGEIKGALLYFEDCDNVRVFGNGGLTSPDASYFDPYLFRFINTHNFLISGQSDTINEGGSNWIGGAFDRWIHANFRTWFPVQDAADGRAAVVVPSEHRPILYLRGNPGYVPFTPVAIEPEQPNPWQSGEAVGDGWRFVDGFGYFYPSTAGFAYHIEHGWLYSASTSFADLWVWHTRDEWLHTTATLYPIFYSADRDGWLLYQLGGTPDEQIFFDLNAEAPTASRYADYP
ncbi:MAG: glycoside hydrolase family 55 protein [Verrucomicrobia bacterium]|nr:glycoside hydrolase family 55 protein [Verrucomicrobiota bacterium]